jgi:predicted dehydrogenase
VSKLKVAIVGAGFVAQKRHIPAFLRLKRYVSLTAVCDLNYELAREVAKKFGIPNAYSDLKEMLSKEQPDIVDVCTPPGAHAPVAIEAMEAGSHVLLEKPMASSLADCDKMIEAAKRNNVKLSVVHNQRFYPPVLKAEELVKSGVVGELTSIRILSLTPRKEYLIHERHWIHKLPGGIIGETGPHVIYLSLVFVKNVRNVNVIARKLSKYPWVLYDDYRIEIEGENITSSILISHATNYTASKMELYGTEYLLDLDLQSMHLIKFKRSTLEPTTIATTSLNIAWQIVKGTLSNAIKVALGRPMLGHDIMVEKFVKSILYDLPVPVTPEEGRETVRILEIIVNKINQFSFNSRLDSIEY